MEKKENLSIIVEKNIDELNNLLGKYTIVALKRKIAEAKKSYEELEKGYNLQLFSSLQDFPKERVEAEKVYSFLNDVYLWRISIIFIKNVIDKDRNYLSDEEANQLNNALQTLDHKYDTILSVVGDDFMKLHENAKQLRLGYEGIQYYCDHASQYNDLSIVMESEKKMTNNRLKSCKEALNELRKIVAPKKHELQYHNRESVSTICACYFVTSLLSYLNVSKKKVKLDEWVEDYFLNGTIYEVTEILLKQYSDNAVKHNLFLTKYKILNEETMNCLNAKVNSFVFRTMDNFDRLEAYKTFINCLESYNECMKKMIKRSTQCSSYPLTDDQKSLYISCFGKHEEPTYENLLAHVQKSFYKSCGTLDFTNYLISKFCMEEKANFDAEDSLDIFEK